MDKPVMLVVDNNRSLFSYLESAAYGTILDIRICSTEKGAIDLSRQLTTESRELAILLVVSNLPDIDGNRVIEEIGLLNKQTNSAILITDNKGRINKDFIENNKKIYIKKNHKNPWIGIVPLINKLLADYAASTGIDKAFIVRKLTNNFQEWDDFCTGRYHIWQDLGWIPKNIQWLDIDEYDFYSDGIAIFESRLHYFNFAGGVRNIIPGKERETKTIIEELMRAKGFRFKGCDLRLQKEEVKKDIVKEYQIKTLLPDDSNLSKLIQEKNISITKTLNHIFQGDEFEIDIENGVVREYSLEKKDRFCLLPAFKIHNKEGELQKNFDLLMKEDPRRVISEVSRLGIQAKYRHVSSQFHLARRLNEEIIAESIISGITDIILCVNPRHYRCFYKQLGAVPIPGIKLEDYYHINAPSMAYRLDINKLKDPKKTNCQQDIYKRVMEYTQKNRNIMDNPRKYVSCTCSNLSRCLMADYQEPIDTPVKYHCPIRYQRFLSPYEDASY